MNDGFEEGMGPLFSIFIVTVENCQAPSLSVTLTVGMYSPELYICVALLEVVVLSYVPSPSKSHSYLRFIPNGLSMTLYFPLNHAVYFLDSLSNLDKSPFNDCFEFILVAKSYKVVFIFNIFLISKDNISL